MPLAREIDEDLERGLGDAHWTPEGIARIKALVRALADEKVKEIADKAESAASLLEVFAESFEAQGDTASWSLASVMAENIRAALRSREDGS